jgi:hypothetical protein
LKPKNQTEAKLITDLNKKNRAKLKPNPLEIKKKNPQKNNIGFGF